MSYAKDARKLANYILSIEGEFKFYSVENKSLYNHIGALFTDIVLQTGINYKTVVKPRVHKVLLEYPNDNTLKKFKKRIDSEGLDYIINWEHESKLNRIYQLIDFSVEHEIDSCFDLKIFLLNDSNREKLLKIDGIGLKTIDYTLKLLNFDVVAVDRHIYAFVEMADIENRGYVFTKKIVEFAADLLDVSRHSLDFSIWSYMSNKNFIPKINSQLELDFVSN